MALKTQHYVRWLFGAKKAGHAGTLDPLATGVLPIALGDATKTVPIVQDGTKTYRFTILWGAETSTDDAEGEVVATSEHRPGPDDIRALLPQFTGEIMQVPPAFSAIKVDGERAYDLARAGEAVEQHAGGNADDDDQNERRNRIDPAHGGSPGWRVKIARAILLRNREAGYLGCFRKARMQNAALEMKSVVFEKCVFRRL